MIDFREELHVTRCKDEFGKPDFFPRYDWILTKTDLTDDTVQTIDWGIRDSIGKICQLIDDFEPTEQAVKIAIRAFLQKDVYDGEQEY